MKIHRKKKANILAIPTCAKLVQTTSEPFWGSGSYTWESNWLNVSEEVIIVHVVGEILHNQRHSAQAAGVL
jgi:hypothetical protein